MPEELYRIAWEKLDLKTALMGRAKTLYGALRELVLERLPELAEQKKTSFAKLRTDFHDYAAGTYKRGGEHAQATGEDIRRTDAFFFLLPLTMAVYSQYEAVKGEILRRLPDTAAPEEGRELIASCLADGVCGLPEPDAVGLGTAFERDGEDEEDGEPPEAFEPLPPESVLPFEVFAENMEFLYVCTWFQRDRILALFQQTPVGKQLVEGGQFSDIGDAQTAVALAKRLLDDQLHPKGFPVEALKVLPEAVYAQWDYAVRSKDKDLPPLWSTPVELHREAVTAEKLEELLTLFSTGRVERLEWSWKCVFPVSEVPMGHESRRSLVLLKSGGWYACLYFDDLCGESYALLERPELYSQGKSRPELVDFRQGRLFRDVLHRNFFTIRPHLEKIFSQVS